METRLRPVVLWRQRANMDTPTTMAMMIVMANTMGMTMDMLMTSQHTRRREAIALNPKTVTETR